MQRTVHAFDPETGAELASLSCTVQPNLAQLSDNALIEECRRELVRLHSLTKSVADNARCEVREEQSPVI